VRPSIADVLAAELGDEHVTADPALLAEYTDPFPLGQAEEFAPGLAVRPGSVEQVQAVLRVAGERGVPVWTVSQGRNNAYGGRGVRVPGSIVMHLERMNRVLDIDEVNGTALVEPGVRFFDLFEAVRDSGAPFWTSVPDLGWGSVIGNALERGLGYTAYGAHNDMSCGLEVVLADGELLRTGLGALPGSRAWQLYKGGYGPSFDGIFAQSNYGVVTKMGLWLMPRPESWAAVDVAMADREGLPALVDAVRPLKRADTIQSTVVIADPMGPALWSSTRADWYDGPGLLPQEVVDRIASAFGGYWHGAFAVYGTPAMVQARLAAIVPAFEAIGARVQVSRYAGDAPDEEIAVQHRTRAGIPGMYAQKLVDWAGGGGGHVAIAPVTPIVGADVMAQIAIMRRRFEEFGFDYTSALTAGPRHLSNIGTILFDSADPEQRARARGLVSALVRELAAAGFAEYRTHLAFMDEVAQVLSFGDHALLRMQDRIKDALDPRGVLAPGKSGIWGSARRG